MEDLIKKAFDKYKEELGKDNNRFLSWNHCYVKFCNARNQTTPDYDNLTLNLAFYLASWGMYRGSSFLLNKDYKIHIGAVKIILENQYDELLGIKCSEFTNSEMSLKS